MVATLEENKAAYEKMKDYLEDEHFFRWVIFYDGELAGIYDDAQDACLNAIARYKRGPYHIRMVGRENIRKQKELMAAAVDRRKIYGEC